MSTNPSTGKELVRRFYEVWNTRRFELFDGLLAPDCLLHFADHAHPMLSEKSRQAQLAWVRSFPDLKFSVHDVVEEGELVAVRLSFEGTQLGEFEGLPASGKHIRVTEMLLAKIKDGKICALWEDYDKLGMMKQLGFTLTRPSGEVVKETVTRQT